MSFNPRFMPGRVGGPPPPRIARSGSSSDCLQLDQSRRSKSLRLKVSLSDLRWLPRRSPAKETVARSFDGGLSRLRVTRRMLLVAATDQEDQRDACDHDDRQRTNAINQWPVLIIQ